MDLSTQLLFAGRMHLCGLHQLGKLKKKTLYVADIIPQSWHYADYVAYFQSSVDGASSVMCYHHQQFYSCSKLPVVSNGFPHSNM